MTERRERRPIPTTVLRDTREQLPWTFETLPVERRDVTLSTGDYTAPKYCTHDPELDTYRPHFAVERKSRHDFLTAITEVQRESPALKGGEDVNWERDRFERELQRAAKWSQPLPVIVESSRQTLLGNRGCMAR